MPAPRDRMTWSRATHRNGSPGMVSAGFGYENVRGDRGGEFGGAGVPRVTSCHANTIVGHHEYHLASGLYPDALEFKHQIEVALDLLTNSPDDNSRGISGCRLCHSLTRLVHCRAHLFLRFSREPQLAQTGNEIAVRAPDRI